MTGVSEAGVTIYHNPACGTSRNTLALIREAGIAPVVIEYLKTPPSRADLQKFAKSTGNGVRDTSARVAPRTLQRETPPRPLTSRPIGGPGKSLLSISTWLTTTAPAPSPNRMHVPLSRQST